MELASSSSAVAPVASTTPPEHSDGAAVVTVTCKGIPFTVLRRFTPLRLLGQGAYGVVCAARVDGSREEVAIKKMQGALRETTNVVEGKRALRELMLLRHLQHENVSCLCDAWVTGTDIYLVSDVMDSDMHRIIGSSQQLSEDHCQWFVYQILRGLKYVHSANVIHRDLKPSNLLLNANCDLKITDFGLARTIEENCGTGGIMTQYVVTRWYRAPEILLFARRSAAFASTARLHHQHSVACCTLFRERHQCARCAPRATASCRYTKAVDIWSTGCIFAELLRRRPMYQGRDQLHQLQLILAQLGTPSAEDLSRVDPRCRARAACRPESAPPSTPPWRGL
jgi:serine/threonine protein kinase